MSFAGRAANSSGFATTPKERGIGWSGCAAQIRLSSLTGSYVMATAEHREPCESRGSRTVLGAPGGEIPPGDSTTASFRDRHYCSGEATAKRFAVFPRCEVTQLAVVMGRVSGSLIFNDRNIEEPPLVLLVNFQTLRRVQSRLRLFGGWPRNS